MMLYGLQSMNGYHSYVAEISDTSWREIILCASRMRMKRALRRVRRSRGDIDWVWRCKRVKEDEKAKSVVSLREVLPPFRPSSRNHTMQE
jgi:hypothetical protein